LGHFTDQWFLPVEVQEHIPNNREMLQQRYRKPNMSDSGDIFADTSGDRFIDMLRDE